MDHLTPFLNSGFMGPGFQGMHGAGSVGGVAFLLLLALAILWTLIWKGVALWTAARNGHKGWFIFFLIINALGIPEIVYLVFFAKRTASTKPEPSTVPE